MEVIRLFDDSFVARHSGKFRLADHASGQKDLESTIDGRNPDPVPFDKKVIAKQVPNIGRDQLKAALGIWRVARKGG